jgi:hypothetical protein
MAALNVTAQEAAIAAAFATELADSLKDGTTGGVTIAPPIPLTLIPQQVIDLYKVVLMTEIRAFLTTYGSALPSFTVAGLPAPATAGAGRLVYVSNESGGAVPAFSDGAAWRRVTDRAVVT